MYSTLSIYFFLSFYMILHLILLHLLQNMSSYITQPKMIAAKLKNYFVYNPPALALLYITIKSSLKYGD